MPQTQNINIALKEIIEDYKTAVSVDCVIFGYDEEELKVLLIECNMEPYIGKWSLLGDLVLPQENIEDATKRVLKYRTGMENVYVEQVRSFGSVNRHPLGRVITVAYYSLVDINEVSITDVDKKNLNWVSMSEAKNLAFDHDDILAYCLERLRERLRARPVGFNLLPKKFTLKQLQSLYEVILNIELDKRNFRRKLKSMDILMDLDEMQENVAHRPARLYSFDFKSYHQRKREKGLDFIS